MSMIRIGLVCLAAVLLQSSPAFSQILLEDDGNYHQGFDDTSTWPPEYWYLKTAWGITTSNVRSAPNAISSSVSATTNFGHAMIVHVQGGTPVVNGKSFIDAIRFHYRISTAVGDSRDIRVMATDEWPRKWNGVDDYEDADLDDLVNSISSQWDQSQWTDLSGWVDIRDKTTYTELAITDSNILSIFDEAEVWIAIFAKVPSGSMTLRIDDFQIILSTYPVPNAPIPISPPQGHETSTRSPAFSWFHNDTDGTPQARYHLQIADSSTFTNIIIDDSNASDRPDTTVELSYSLPYPADSILFWRVRTSNFEDSYSAWSSNDSWFRARLIPPDTPTIISPDTSHETTVRTVRFQWIHNDPDTSPQTQAEIQLCRAPDMADTSWILFVADTSTSADTTFAAEEDTIYWRIRTKDDVDLSPWTESRVLYLVYADTPVFQSIVLTGETPARLVTPNLFDTGTAGDTVWFGPAAQLCTAVVTVASRRFDSVAVSAIFDSPARVMPAPSPVSILFQIAPGHALPGETLVTLVAWDRSGATETTRIRFRPDTVAPETVALMAPESGAFVGATPTCTWTVALDTDGVGLDRYILQIAATPDFAAILREETTTATSLTLGAPLADSIYFWRVLAVDRVENLDTATAVIRTFTIDSTAPTPAIPTAPADAYETSHVPIRFEWTASTDSLSGIAWQRLEIARDSSFAALDTSLLLGALDTTTIAGDTLVGSDTFWWRIASRDSAGNETVSVKRSFILDTTPPNPAALSLPADAHDTSVTSIRFTWSAATDSHTGVASYRIQVDTDPAFGAPLFDSNVALQTETDLILPANDTYRWRILVADRVGNIETGAARILRIDTAPPSRPTLIAPIGGETRLAPAGFQWSAATDSLTGLASYRLQAATDSVFTVLTLDQALDSTVTSDTRWLDTGLWYWRVLAIDLVGNTETSLVDTVQVEAPPDTTPPAAFSLLGPPANAETNAVAILFRWQDAADSSPPVRYTLTVLNGAGALAYETTIIETSVLATLPANDSYRWSVTATDSPGNTRLSAETFILRIDTAPPVAFSLLAPATNTETNATAVTFSWQTATDSSDIVRYTLTVITAADVLAYETTILGTSIAVTLPANDSYRWSVTATDSPGNARLSTETFILRIDTAPPSTFSLLTPTTALETTATSILFSWQRSSDSSAVIRYTLTVLTAAGAIAHETTVFDTSVLATLPANDSYRWSVTAADTLGNARLSTETFTLVVDTAPPSTPVLLTPANAEDTIAPVLFRWLAATDSHVGLDSYRLEVSSAAAFDTGLAADSVLSTTETSVTLEIGTWYWRVKVSDRLGNAAISETRSVRVVIASESVPPIILAASATPALVTNVEAETTRLTITAIDTSRIDTVVAHLSILGAHYPATMMDTTADSTQWRLDVTIDTRVLGDTYLILLTVTDRYGNTSETRVQFVVADVSPTFSEITNIILPPGETVLPVSGNALTLAVETGSIPGVTSVHFEYRPSGDSVWIAADASPYAGTPNPATGEPPWTFVWALPDTSGQYDIRAVGVTADGESDPSPSFLSIALTETPSLIQEYWSAESQSVTFLLIKDTAQAFHLGRLPLMTTSVSTLTSSDTLRVRAIRHETAPASAPAPDGRTDGSGLRTLNGVGFFQFQIMDAGRNLDQACTISLRLGGITGESRAALSWYRFDTAANRWTRQASTLATDPSGDTVILSVSTTRFSIWAPLLALAEANLAGVIVYPNPYIPYDNTARTGVPYVHGVDGTGVIFDRLTEVVSIEIYTIAGVRVATIRSQNSGGRIHWNARSDDRRDLASGVYLCVIKSGTGERVIRKLMIIR
jgi:hypothetical protein